jgi:hypothetical protein
MTGIITLQMKAKIETVNPAAQNRLVTADELRVRNWAF